MLQFPRYSREFEMANRGRGEPGPNAPSAYAPEKQRTWYANDLRALLNDWPMKAVVYVAFALVFWFCGFRWWWYWPLAIARGILRGFLGLF
jgi:hypothetical protein